MKMSSFYTVFMSCIEKEAKLTFKPKKMFVCVSCLVHGRGDFVKNMTNFNTQTAMFWFDSLF